MDQTTSDQWISSWLYRYVVYHLTLISRGIYKSSSNKWDSIVRMSWLQSTSNHTKQTHFLMSSINNFQTLLDQQVGTLPIRSWPVVTGMTSFSYWFSIDMTFIASIDRPKKQRPIPISSLRFQGAVWATAGGSMYATLHGVYRIFRNFRGFKYIWICRLYLTRDLFQCVSDCYSKSEPISRSMAEFFVYSFSYLKGFKLHIWSNYHV